MPLIDRGRKAENRLLSQERHGMSSCQKNDIIRCCTLSCKSPGSLVNKGSMEKVPSPAYRQEESRFVEPALFLSASRRSGGSYAYAMPPSPDAIASVDVAASPYTSASIFTRLRASSHSENQSVCAWLIGRAISRSIKP